MLKYSLDRLVQAAIVLFIVSLVIFTLPRLVASPASVLLPPNATAEDEARLEQLWGLDQPLPVQYLTFLRNALVGDFGESRVFRQPAIDVITSRFPVSLRLTAGALVLIVVLGCGGGILAALRHNRPMDGVIRTAALLFQSVPNFWLGIVLAYIFAVRLKFLPAAGTGSWQHYVLPVVALSHFPLAAVLRITRVSMLEVLDSDFVEFARAKGLPESKVILRHALRNALISPLTYLGFTLATLLTGSVVVETVFAMPGVGMLAVQSIRSLDYAVVQSLILIFAFIYLFVNFLVDVAYGFVDPRIIRGVR